MYGVAIFFAFTQVVSVARAAGQNGTWWPTPAKYGAAVGGGFLIGHALKKNHDRGLAQLNEQRRWQDQLRRSDQHWSEKLRAEQTISQRRTVEITALQKQIVQYKKDYNAGQKWWSEEYESLRRSYEDMKKENQELKAAMVYKHQSNHRLRSLVVYWQNVAQELEEERDTVWRDNVYLTVCHLTASNERLTRSLCRSEMLNDNLKRQVYLLKHLQATNGRFTPRITEV